MDPPSLNPADVMAKANQSIPNTSSISADENALLQAKEKIKMIKHRVDSLKKQMNDYLITIKNWQLQQEKTCAFCAESIDPSAAVSFGEDSCEGASPRAATACCRAACSPFPWTRTHACGRLQHPQ